MRGAPALVTVEAHGTPRDDESETTMTQQVHEARATASASRVSTPDGSLDVGLAVAGDADGSDGATSPEHLMAAALAGCLHQALQVAASSQGASAVDAHVEATVTLESGDGSGYTSSFVLEVTGLPADTADRVLEQAAALCPFTKALAGERLTLRTA